MTTFDKINIRTVEDCYMGDPMDQAGDYFDFGQGEYDLSPQQCNPVNINSWSFSPLPSPESPFLDTPMSTTYQDSNWNPIDRTFNSVMTPESMDTEFFAPDKFTTKAFEDAYNNAAELQQTEPWSTASAASSDCVSASQTSASLSSVYSPTRQSYPSSPLDTQPGWGKSLPSSRTSTHNTRLSKRSKSKNETPGPATTSAPQQRLRSTSTAVAANSRPTTSSTSSYSSNSPPKHARLNHNQVEKQYRNRLNGQFETLLLALPREDGEGGEGKKRSKAEVLMLARKHIRDLERDRRRLEDGAWEKILNLSRGELQLERMRLLDRTDSTLWPS
ncbi:hypothetical protein DL98DRAFT_130244 [Cadophora sp. DSE1049]|nr:hypothetical protein DL98DRAFT_130244 [Cadophora sp. DSE1049]